MNIQTRKLNVINYIVNLTDEPELRRIEEEILKNKEVKKENTYPLPRKNYFPG
jgi:hypothetical protein